MPDNNLSISISADSSKARADIELLKAQLRAAQKDARDFAKAGAEAGDKFPSAQLTAAAGRVGALDAQLKALNRTAAQTSGAMDVLATKSMRRLLTQFDSFGKSAQNIAMVMGGVTGSFAGGFLAASVFKGLSTLIDQLDAVNQKLRELRETARETGQRPAAIAAARRIAQREGVDASVADKIMGSGAEDFAKAKTAAGKPISLTGVKDLTQRTQEATDATNQYTSAFNKQIAELRGASPILFDVAKAYGIIGVKAEDYKDTVAGEEKFNRDRMIAFVKLAASGRMSANQINELSKGLFKGLPADSFLEVAPTLIANLDTEIKKLGDLDARMKLSKAADAARGQRNEVFSGWFDSIVDFWNRMDVAANNWQTNFLTKTLPEFGARFKQAFSDISEALLQQEKDQGEAWVSGLPDFQPWIDKTIAAFQGMWDSIKAAAASARDTLSRSFPGDPSIPAMPMAGGGLIRGPGTGTSDSILARLSDGEFVMRAAAVNRWGPRFMAALNSLQNPFGYHAGGLVPRFATGGMVTARMGDGTVVNLHFPGGSFALRGDAAIVGGLTREARRAGMLSAGRMAGALA